MTLLASTVAPSAVHAQAVAGEVETSDAEEPPAPPSTGPRVVGYGAMPGGLHVASAETLPKGTAQVSALAGFGYRKGLLGDDHSFNRAIGELAVAFAPLPNLSIGLSLDGRRDSHKGLAGPASMDGDGARAADTDDAYVGDPHLMARYAVPLGKISVGGQLGVWAPGKDAPSIVASAISVDARALLSVDAGFGTFSANAGFRLDNSAEAIDAPDDYSHADRVSLGVSDFSAALAGLSLRIPAGRRAFVELEGSADVFVGSDAPGPIVRGGGLVGVSLDDTFSVIGFVEAARVPKPDSVDAVMAGKLVPYEPTITGGLGLQARFGGGKRVAATQVTVNERPRAVEVAETADVSGVVLDDAGKPVVGARVTIKLKHHSGNAITDGKGVYSVQRLPIGKTIDGRTELDDTGAEIAVELADKKPGAATLSLVKGPNAAPPIVLDPMLPPGQLRAVITNAGTGRPVPGASVTIEPGDITQTAGPDGKFTVDLPPGRYKITVTARGLARQQLDVNIEQNGVAIKNIELRK